MTRAATALAALVLLAALASPPARAATFEPVACPGGVDGVVVSATDDEFFGAYAGVFHMSDGSAIQGGAGGGASGSGGLGASAAYFYTLMRAVGAEVVGASGGGGVAFRVCGAGNATRLALLAVVGNFVSPAADQLDTGGVGGRRLPTVVVDARTGQLDLVGSLSAMRAYFLEAMLVISILAIARLSMVQTVSVPLGQDAKHT